MTPSEHSVDDLAEIVEDLQTRVSDLEAENQRLTEENQRLREELEAKDERIDHLEARLRRYENPHTPPSKQRDTATTDDDEDLQTDGGTIGRNPGHDPAWRPLPEPDEVVDVTAETCPDCGEALDEAVDVTPRFIEEIPDPDPIETTRYDLHHYECDGCGDEVQASHPECPTDGQFGTTVQAQAALARYEYRLPYRKVADRFDQLFELDLSAASAWHTTERVARAGRDEYERIRDRIRAADVIHVDETGLKLDGQQAWLWTFRAGEDVLFAIRESRGSTVIEEILGERFDGTIVCDGWTAYPAVTDVLQRCWAHLLREADDVAEEHVEAEPIADRLHRLFDGLQTFLDEEPTVEHREQMRERARTTLDQLVETEVEHEAVENLLGKVEGGLGHWLAFVTDPAIEPTNNAAENALREPVVLRKIIGTLRTESGRVTHETLLSLLATWKQQDLNPYNELKRVATPVTT